MSEGSSMTRPKY